MTYPPQQPGPYGPQGPYGQQPDPFAGQSAYQGLGGYPGGGEPPAPENTGKIVAIVAIAVLLLGGAGAAVFFLTKGDDKPTASAPASSAAKPEPSGTDQPTDTKSTKPKAEPTGAGSPQEIVDAYIAAYQDKDFSAVTAEACEAYKNKYGTDTTSLEAKLSKFEVKGTAKGEPEVKGSVATAQIDLALTPETGEPKDAHIRIKIIKEDGAWRFCGEEPA
ncbi:hypothetical protein [Actinokineospora sp.]|uniref:hypothetical protein n=1 Tax=Actinokineospora sp. TaxID=1872133 RepID=UPI003D6A4189